ncbi:MAG: GDP-mannose 4,6-dehydratase [Chlamydiae bacterium]|nr:GDP-mannose 4,6-dehydratase [Chlamydiota bacterium]MBI3267195.1 GDP-mannose 4,6-dehydratase [Chlamydiota bacterium]
MNILITGVSGFAGSHLAEYIAGHVPSAVKIHGTYFHLEEAKKNLGPLFSKLKLFHYDTSHPETMAKILRESSPEIIFNLAGIAYVPDAEKDKFLTYQINTLSVDNLLEGVSKICPGAKMILISSSEVYGKVKPDETPLTEKHPVNPHNIYGASKGAMELIGRYYFNHSGLQIITLRAFNHAGPRQSDRFVISNFCRQAAKIKLGISSPRLEVGDLEPQRDFTDVRDVVRGYWNAAIRGKVGETYNLCSGSAHSIKKIASMIAPLADPSIEIFQDPTRLRKSNLPLLLGSFQKFQADTGWKPDIPLEKTLQDVFEFWMKYEKAVVSCK